MAHKISNVEAREILDSRGNRTIRVGVWTGDHCGTFSVPAGASTGAYEAVSKDAKDAVRLVNTEIREALKGQDVNDQNKIDNTLIKLDGSDNKSRLGANSILGASIACAKTAAFSGKMEVYEYLRTLAKIKSSHRVPYLYMNLINGGKHASSFIAFQEYLVVPMVEDVEMALRMGADIQRALKDRLIKEYSPFSANIGDEGGYVPEAKTVREPLAILAETIGSLGLKNKVRLALDTASSSFYSKGLYEVDGQKLGKDELMELFKNLVKEFNIFSIEDPFEENDFESFTQLRAVMRDGYVVGDDLTVTNAKRLRQAIDKNSVNAIIIKPNQIGTLSETLAVMKLAGENGIECIVSHRSGETNDDFIADLAYAFGTFGLKTGAPRRGERVAKYNRLWEIADHK
ncbi:MAG: enolase C-terminal domain-like protein [Patescibacteria group bacterium]